MLSRFRYPVKKVVAFLLEKSFSPLHRLAFQVAMRTEGLLSIALLSLIFSLHLPLQGNILYIKGISG